MKESVNERRQAENEVIFRQANEKVSNTLDEVKAAAQYEGNNKLANEADVKLHFLCECSDEKCTERIILSQSTYKRLHSNTSQFIVLPGHIEPTVEHIVKATKSYLVVEKYMTPPKNVRTLRITKSNSPQSKR